MKQLLTHFKELTLHPKNAEELKGLILQLAIQGKLTAQWRKENPDVEPASTLLEKINAEKARLIKEKKIKKEKPLPTVEDEDLNQSIPDTWLFTRLGEIGDWGAGATPSRSRSDFYGGTINWFKSGELNNGVMDYNSKETINELAIKNSSLRLNKIGDVLVAMYGATIGKTGILAVEGATNQAVCACTPFTCISNRYLHLLLKALKEVFINQGEGGAQPNISRVKLRNQIFPLPPLEEQKAIVAIVNQLFAEVAQLEALTKERAQLKEDFVSSVLQQLTQAAAQDTASQWTVAQEHFGTFFTEKANVKKLRESILQLAVQGKLTAKWRESHPVISSSFKRGDAAKSDRGVHGVEHASVLLERIQSEKAQLIADKKIKKEKPLPPITEEEIPYALPEGWVWCRLGYFVRFMAYGTSQKTNDNYNNVPVLRMGNITSSGELHFKNLKYIPATHRDLPKLYLKDGDLVFNRTNSYELVGKSGVFRGAEKTYTLASYLIKVSLFTDYVNADYINNYIISPVCRKTQIEPQITAQTNQANFSGSKLKEVLVPLAPSLEQKAIVRNLNALMALCDQLENEIETRTTTQEKWMQSCLREVFEGEREASNV